MKRQRAVRQGVVIAIMVALATSVFFGAIRVMSPEGLGHALQWVMSDDARPAPPDDYDDEDDPAPAVSPDGPEPSSEP